MFFGLLFFSDATHNSRNMKRVCSLFMGGLFLPPTKIFSIGVDDFLRLASYLEKEEKCSARCALNKGVPFGTLPFLRLEKICSEFYMVNKHNGRHRAMVLRDNGYETIPVRLCVNQPLDLSLRIKAQEDAKDPDFTIPLPSPLTLDP